MPIEKFEGVDIVERFLHDRYWEGLGPSWLQEAAKEILALREKVSVLERELAETVRDKEVLDGAYGTALIAVDTLTKQRDSLRRSYCEFQSAAVKDSRPEAFAENLGWDCFERKHDA